MLAGNPLTAQNAAYQRLRSASLAVDPAATE